MSLRNRGKKTKHRFRQISTLRQDRGKRVPGPLFLFFLALLAFAIGILLDGCERAPSPSGSSAVGTANELRDQANIRSIENAVRNYREMRGENPRSLDELIENGLLEEMPVPSPGHRYAFDPDSGAVAVRPDSSAAAQNPAGEPSVAGVLDAALDAKSNAELKKIKTAIAVFQAQEGRYPATLEALVESGILDKLPETPSGTRFQYDPGTGKVTRVKAD